MWRPTSRTETCLFLPDAHPTALRQPLPRSRKPVSSSSAVFAMPNGLSIKWVFTLDLRSVVIPAKAGIQETQGDGKTSGSRIGSGMTERGVCQQAFKRLKLFKRFEPSSRRSLCAM